MNWVWGINYFMNTTIEFSMAYVNNEEKPFYKSMSISVLQLSIIAYQKRLSSK